MRVLMTADTVGGVWTYAMELCRALAPHGVEVMLASMGSRASTRQRLEAAACSNVRYVESQYRLEWMDDPWSEVADAGEWLMNLRREFKPDLIHLNGFCHGDLEWEAPVVLVAHSCVLSWWKAVKDEPAPPTWARYRARVTSGARAASMVVAPSQAMLDSFVEEYGPFRATRVIYNGRDSASFRPSSKDCYVLSAGRIWDEAKNIRLLQEAAPDIIWPIHVAGDQERPDGREGRAHTNVRVLGQLSTDQVASALSRASVYALPAIYEPFGFSILEAAFSGCALVLGDIPSLREIWSDAAIYVDPHDVADITEQVNLLCADHALRRSLALSARGRAARYTPTRMAEGYMQTYRELLGGPAAAGYKDVPNWTGLHT